MHEGPKGMVKPWGKLTQKWLQIWEAVDCQIEAWLHANCVPRGWDLVQVSKLARPGYYPLSSANKEEAALQECCIGEDEHC